MTPAFHSLHHEMVLSLLGSRHEGLTEEEVAFRRATFGLNRIPKKSRVSPAVLLWRQITSPLIYILILAAGAAFLMGRFSDSLVVFGVVVINVLIGFFQEYKAHQAIDSLSELVPEFAVVLRNGHKHTIACEELVPGDLVYLQSGDRISADLRLLKIKSLKVDESSLTGESVPVEKRIEPLSDGTLLSDRKNMTYAGTFVTYGTAVAVVVATGEKTELAKISELIEKAAPLDTPLTRQFQKVAARMTWAILALSLGLFAVALWQERSVADGVLIAVTLAVAAIPEGLPAVITIALAIGVRRMARSKAIVRELPAVETLGCTTVICTDKTGTLTRNEMTVCEVDTPNVKRLYISAVLCNDATLKGGDPTEKALLVSAEERGFSVEEIKKLYPRIDEIPFESDRQYMATIHEQASQPQSRPFRAELGDGKFPEIRSVEESPSPKEGILQTFVCVKGAPEVVAKMSQGAPRDLEERLALFARKGMRMLAFAEGKSLETLEWLGFVGMIDPPRTESKEALKACREAGIEVVMITGDHKETAQAIGKELGFSSHQVHSRVTPEQKLRLVQQLQAKGQVVAMTGDGVNDAPALKQADIGIAMGIAGTAVAKEAADLILADDHFATIAAAVEEGRHVYDNLMKAFAFILPTNLGLALILIAGVFLFPTQLPMLPIQILWINLVATITLALPCGFEAKEPDLMKRAPRKASDSLLSPFILFRTCTVALLMAVAALIIDESQTLSVTTVVFFQIFYLLMCRSLRNPVRKMGFGSNPTIYFGIAAILFLQMAYVYFPPLQALFSSEPLDFSSWMISLGCGILIVPVIFLEKVLLMKNSFYGTNKIRGKKPS